MPSPTAPATSIPTLAEVKAAIPAECFERSFAKSFAYALMSVVLTISIGFLAWLFIPLTWQWTPAWIAYAYVNGTVATGVWVAAHECGHRGFAKGTRAQDAVGFVLHSSLLVPTSLGNAATPSTMARPTISSRAKPTYRSATPPVAASSP